LGLFYYYPSPPLSFGLLSPPQVRILYPTYHSILSQTRCHYLMTSTWVKSAASRQIRKATFSFTHGPAIRPFHSEPPARSRTEARGCFSLIKTVNSFARLEQIVMGSSSRSRSVSIHRTTSGSSIR